MERNPAIFRRIVVLLDGLAPSQGAFAHALDWAGHLQLPILAVLGSDCQPQPGSPASPPGGTLRPRAGAGVGIAQVVADCAAACGQRGVPWQTASWEAQTVGLSHHLRQAGDLVVLGRASAPAQNKTWLRAIQLDLGLPVLFCPDNWIPCSRILVLNQQHPAQESLLTAAVELCRGFQARAVILTVARSERVAQAWQRATQEALADSGLCCDFDLVSGAEVPAAVAQVARWRRCQVILTAHPFAPRWWRRWRSGTTEKLFGLAGEFSFLAIPEACTLDSSHHQQRTQPACREFSPRPLFH